MKDFTQHINKVVIPKLKKELGEKNNMAIPKIQKIVINVGIGSQLKNNKDFSVVVDNIAAITGQKPIVTMAKQAISNFKLRADTPNGIMTTLRKKKMLDFYNRMINVAFPRIRDFQGFSPKAFDGNGNYSIGLRDCSIFPEINPDDLNLIHGMSITIVTSATNNESAKKLLDAINFPFKKAPKKEDESSVAEHHEAKVDESSVAEHHEAKVDESSVAEHHEAKEGESSVAEHHEAKEGESSVAEHHEAKVDESSVAEHHEAKVGGESKE